MKTFHALPEFDDATSRLSPEDYRKHLASIDLNSIVLEEVSTTLNRQLAEEVDSFDFRVEREMRFSRSEATGPELLLDYVIRGLHKSKPVARIKATYRLTFHSSEELSLDFFAIYGSASADSQVWPYLRELASSLTSRMGIPQLTLPLLTETRSLQKSKPKLKGGSD